MRGAELSFQRFAQSLEQTGFRFFDRFAAARRARLPFDEADRVERVDDIEHIGHRSTAARGDLMQARSLEHRRGDAEVRAEVAFDLDPAREAVGAAGIEMARELSLR